MPTQQSTIDFLLDQIEDTSKVRTRKMFGEYAFYFDKKVVGLVCDNQLFLKITLPGKELIGDLYEEGLPYPGAKPWMLIPEEIIEDRERFSELLSVTAGALPLPKPKKVKKKI